ncbi:1-(5-phosphoribosyl)-5-[(5-phosphoribosylamino)methylideneamino]imidazole-4-carboxamide isomerase [Asaia prunellae]|uniref:1-(5-phosphoribosyl)-5-[(5- phosphoribosylamino)methylideneamino]imidazole-4- carboxamide isomerase n=1 Tax=Asaia prunellae TaxID=610245 RepID=UPI000A40B6AE|nr:1-(5-phosphoribosyl)-5-[(5-phosphoribosylamino)methylideneamino]imidazole-4-carboxamide isomerase [Asaia prunellae]
MTCSAERLTRIDETDMAALCEITTATILDGGGLGWLTPPGRVVLERYFNGLLLVPETRFFVVRDETGQIQGCAQLVRPPRNNEAQAQTAQIRGYFVVPYMRGRGLGYVLADAVISAATAMGCRVLNCEVPETQESALAMFRSLGFEHWGTHPYYARNHEGTVKGIFMTKRLEAMPSLHRHKKHPAKDIGVANTDKLQNRSLTLYPAIDLKDGACVRLRRGEMDDATVYSDNPAAQALEFARAGCSRLHVVDLNGAFAGRSANGAAVEAILAATALPVQLGGGIRDMAGIARWLEAGLDRVILGSVAVKNPDLVREACKAFPGRIVAGIDARQGRVATEGWAEVSELNARDLALRMQDAGVAAVIFTEITRDGMLEGLDLEQTADLACRLSIPVIASGGVGSAQHLRDFRAVAQEVHGLEGVIVGRALYDGRIPLAEAISIVEGD